MTDRRHDAYRSFVAAARREPNEGGYLFDTPRCRFDPEAGDELVAPPGTEVVRVGAGVAIQLPNGPRLLVTGFTFEKLRSVFSQLPCRYSRLTIELGNHTQSLMDQLFSRVLFAPRAVAELETQLPSVELVRFPGSPYELERAYWRNSCVLRRRLAERVPAKDAAELCSLLLELHELLLVGEDKPEGRRSFYLPASLLGRKRPAPGTFYDVPSGLEQRGAETILTSGARVGVPLLGGFNYWQLLTESVDDAGAVAQARRLSVAGLDLGQVVHARAEDEAESRPWFLPPRPLRAEHFEALVADLQAAHAAERAGDVPATLAALGAFHYRFVRTHPLPSANQSLSMSFVNDVLGRLLGSGMPHLLLDQLALRFELSAYQRLFSRAARVWTAWAQSKSEGGGGRETVTTTERLRHLIRMRTELNDFVSALGSSTTLIEARALLVTRRSGAELALLSDT